MCTEHLLTLDFRFVIIFVCIGDWQCPRVTTLYQAIKCPEGHYKVLEDQFDQQCELQGLSCPKEKGYSCYCKPCIKAFEVDLFQFDKEDGVLDSDLIRLGGCDKVRAVVAIFFVTLERIEQSNPNHLRRCRCVAKWNRESS